MQKRWIIASFFFITLIWGSCASKSSETMDDEVWGMYVGELPCDDCRGVLTYVTLGKDSMAAITRVYYDSYGTSETKYGNWDFDDSLFIVSVPDEILYYKILSDSTLLAAKSSGVIPKEGGEGYLLTKQFPDAAKNFAGTYVQMADTSEVGYRQVLTISVKDLNTVAVKIGFSGAQKGCEFSATGKIMNNQIEIDLSEVTPDMKSTMVIRPVSDKEMSVSTSQFENRYDLNYYCGGGASLAGDYKKVK